VVVSVSMCLILLRTCLSLSGCLLTGSGGWVAGCVHCLCVAEHFFAATVYICLVGVNNQVETHTYKDKRKTVFVAG